MSVGRSSPLLPGVRGEAYDRRHEKDWIKNPALAVFHFVVGTAFAGEGVHWGLRKLDMGGAGEPWWVWSILLSGGVLFWLLITVKDRIVELSERDGTP